MTNPQYPVYIISKGRAELLLTSRALSAMKVYHYIAIEPQEEDVYDKSLDTFNIRKYVKLLILPFSNHGKGPGVARNWCWDHSKKNGFKKHWVMDDNIHRFYRLNENRRVRVDTGLLFKISEDFVDRYANVPVAGLQYMGFVIPGKNVKPFILNSRIYSCLLIDNDCKYKWRGKYNEDTDLSLRILKDGDCTIEFNFFMADKVATQRNKGGNTEEFYHAENMEDGVKYNPNGTINKSQMLVDMHPDVTKLVWRYDRWHHHVDYSSFKNNKLRLKDGVNLNNFDKIDEYGLKLINISGK